MPKKVNIFQAKTSINEKKLRKKSVVILRSKLSAILRRKNNLAVTKFIRIKTSDEIHRKQKKKDAVIRLFESFRGLDIKMDPSFSAVWTPRAKYSSAQIISKPRDLYKCKSDSFIFFNITNDEHIFAFDVLSLRLIYSIHCFFTDS